MDSFTAPRYAAGMSSGSPPFVGAPLRRHLAGLRARDIGIRFVTLGADRLFVDSLDRYAAAMAWRFGWRDGPAQRLIAREVGP